MTSTYLVSQYKSQFVSHFLNHQQLTFNRLSRLNLTNLLNMQFTTTFFTLASILAVTSAMAVSEPVLEKRIADPGNPANLVNCEPGGGADDCHLEKPVCILN